MRSLLEDGCSSGETPEYRGEAERSHSVCARIMQKVSYERLTRNESAATLAGATARGADGSRRLVVGDGAHAADLRETGFLQRTIDAVADPLRVPPLERRDRYAGDQHLEVQMIAKGQELGRTGATGLAIGDHLQPEP